MNKLKPYVLLSLSCIVAISGCASGGGGPSSGGVQNSQPTAKPTVTVKPKPNPTVTVKPKPNPTVTVKPKPTVTATLKGNITPSSTPPSLIKGINTQELMMAPSTTKHFKLDSVAKQRVQEVLFATNKLRADKGLPPLALDSSLTAYATVRSEELGDLFAHKRLNGMRALHPTNFKKGGIRGENVAGGFRTGSDVTEAWRKSPGHYKNMMGQNFTKIGIGYYSAYDPVTKRTSYYWTQVFGGTVTESKYSFIDPINLDVNDVKNVLKQNTQYSSDKKMTVTAAKDASGFHKISLSGHQIALQPMDALGFSYQTFGQLNTTSNGVPLAYVNVGKIFKFNGKTELKAHYEGKSIGDLGQHSLTTADMSADVNFSSKGKTMTVEFKNSKIANGDLNINSANFVTDTSLDFKDTLTWRSDVHQFENERGKARLYGNNAEEIGGQFEKVHTNKKDIYRGVYGGKRTK